MAKGIAINGQLRGKLGGVVYYRSNGQQISRARAENVSNPNTQPQRIQRMIMATVMQAYSLTKEITDHSFEGIKYKQDSMAFFQRVNANKLRAMISAENAAFTPSFTAPRVQALIPNGYTISRGSLEPIPFTYQTTNPGFNVPTFGDNLGSNVTALALSFGEFMTALRATPGDMVTLVWIDGDSVLYQYGDDDSEERAQVKYTTMRYIRMKFKESYTAQELDETLFTGTDAAKTVNKTLFYTEESSNLDDLADVTIFLTGNQSFLCAPNIDAHCIGVIRSRRVDGSWRRSLCEMKVNPGYHFGLSYENGLLAWENTTSELGSGDWLLNDKKTGINP